jgi:hypothetical protein
VGDVPVQYSRACRRTDVARAISQRSRHDAQSRVAHISTIVAVSTTAADVAVTTATNTVSGEQLFWYAIVMSNITICARVYAHHDRCLTRALTLMPFALPPPPRRNSSRRSCSNRVLCRRSRALRRNQTVSCIVLRSCVLTAHHHTEFAVWRTENQRGPQSPSAPFFGNALANDAAASEPPPASAALVFDKTLAARQRSRTLLASQPGNASVSSSLSASTTSSTTKATTSLSLATPAMSSASTGGGGGGSSLVHLLGARPQTPSRRRPPVIGL